MGSDPPEGGRGTPGFDGQSLHRVSVLPRRGDRQDVRRQRPSLVVGERRPARHGGSIDAVSDSLKYRGRSGRLAPRAAGEVAWRTIEILTAWTETVGALAVAERAVLEEQRAAGGNSRRTLEVSRRAWRWRARLTATGVQGCQGDQRQHLPGPRRDDERHNPCWPPQ